MRRTLSARLLIGMVLFFNLQCAVEFIFRPDIFVPGFELSGIGGSAAVQGMGILFLMWNVPYLFALIHPVRNRLSLIEAIVMQAIGAFGESLLLLQIYGSHPQLCSSVTRFIVFDTVGLVGLIVAFFVTRHIDR